MLRIHTYVLLWINVCVYAFYNQPSYVSINRMDVKANWLCNFFPHFHILSGKFTLTYLQSKCFVLDFYYFCQRSRHKKAKSGSKNRKIKSNVVEKNTSESFFYPSNFSSRSICRNNNNYFHFISSKVKKMAYGKNGMNTRTHTFV